MFDMTKCKIGDKLVSCHGMVFEYVGKSNCEIFPHKVKYPNGSFGTRSDDGQVFLRNKFPSDHDIVGFYKGDEL